MSDDVLLVEQRGPVRLLTLNRPERLNAWNDALEAAYFAALDTAADDPEVAAVVVTGAGRGFCAGADMVDLARAGQSDGQSVGPRTMPREYPLSFPKPLIAAINGAVAGLGFVEALYCDVRFAVPTAKLLTVFSQRGLIAEYGIAWLLPQIVGRSRALDLLLSGRTITGTEAHRIGLVDFLAESEDVVQAAVDYAASLARTASPWSMSMIKQQVVAAGDESFDEAVARAEELMRESFVRSDIDEGVAAYEERRPPRFDPLPPRADLRV